MNKYRNRKVEMDGHWFDSKKEARRYSELKLLEESGKISKLKLQERFCLVPTIEGKDGKVVQRAVYYVADFTYYEPWDYENNGEYLRSWRRVVEDVKGVRTDLYKLKKKLMRWRYGIDIREV